MLHESIQEKQNKIEILCSVSRVLNSWATDTACLPWEGRNMLGFPNRILSWGSMFPYPLPFQKVSRSWACQHRHIIGNSFIQKIFIAHLWCSMHGDRPWGRNPAALHSQSLNPLVGRQTIHSETSKIIPDKHKFHEERKHSNETQNRLSRHFCGMKEGKQFLYKCPLGNPSRQHRCPLPKVTGGEFSSSPAMQ